MEPLRFAARENNSRLSLLRPAARETMASDDGGCVLQQRRDEEGSRREMEQTVAQLRAQLAEALHRSEELEDHNHQLAQDLETATILLLQQRSSLSAVKNARSPSLEGEKYRLETREPLRQGTDHRPFDNGGVVEAGSPAVVELTPRPITGSVDHLQHRIDIGLEVVASTVEHQEATDSSPNPSFSSSSSFSHSSSASFSSPSSSSSSSPLPQSASYGQRPTASTRVSDHYVSVPYVDHREEEMVDYEEGEPISPSPECVPASRAHSASSVEEDREKKPQPQEQPAVQKTQQQPAAVSWPSSPHPPPHSHPAHVGAITRVSFDHVEFVNPRHRSRTWQLAYRGKGTFAQVYVGKSTPQLGPFSRRHQACSRSVIVNASTGS